MKERAHSTEPRRWDWLFRGFQRYSARYLRQHFHGVRLSRSGQPLPTGKDSLLIVLNHSAWWDPLICMYLATKFPAHTHHGAIDAAAVERYPFFKRIGFVGVDTQSLRGAVTFLRAASALLSRPENIFWITAQGRFSDVRERPLNLRSGVGFLAERLERGLILPLAIEYTFWTERTPEALIRFGRPLSIADHPGTKGKEWTAIIEAALTETLDGLNRETVTRDPKLFDTLLEGRVGVGGVYDLWRRAKSWLRGKRFDPAHGGP